MVSVERVSEYAELVRGGPGRGASRRRPAPAEPRVAERAQPFRAIRPRGRCGTDPVCRWSCAASRSTCAPGRRPASWGAPAGEVDAGVVGAVAARRQGERRDSGSTAWRSAPALGAVRRTRRPQHRSCSAGTCAITWTRSSSTTTRAVVRARRGADEGRREPSTASAGSRACRSTGRTTARGSGRCSASRSLRCGTPRSSCLDEATASVDLETDKVMQDVIADRFASRTIMTIAHRINTIIENDKVVCLDGAASWWPRRRPPTILRREQHVRQAGGGDARGHSPRVNLRARAEECEAASAAGVPIVAFEQERARGDARFFLERDARDFYNVGRARAQPRRLTKTRRSSDSRAFYTGRPLPPPRRRRRARGASRDVRSLGQERGLRTRRTRGWGRGRRGEVRAGRRRRRLLREAAQERAHGEAAVLELLQLELLEVALLRELEGVEARRRGTASARGSRSGASTMPPRYASAAAHRDHLERHDGVEGGKAGSLGREGRGRAGKRVVLKARAGVHSAPVSYHGMPVACSCATMPGMASMAQRP